MEKPKRPDLSIGHNLKIALFHLGSGMADVLTTGVWNRIMVADLGFSATFVGLLTGLRYFLAPIGVMGRALFRHTYDWRIQTPVLDLAGSGDDGDQHIDAGLCHC